MHRLPSRASHHICSLHRIPCYTPGKRPATIPHFHNSQVSRQCRHFTSRNYPRSQYVEDEYNRLRSLARRQYDNMVKRFTESQEEYLAGHRALAASLSVEGNRHKRLAAAYDRRASNLIFCENNPLDLHGQYQQEAEDLLEARIRDGKDQGLSHLHVLVGRGTHSPANVARLGMKVAQVCKELGLRFEAVADVGRITIDLGGREEALEEDRG